MLARNDWAVNKWDRREFPPACETLVDVSALQLVSEAAPACSDAFLLVMPLRFLRLRLARTKAMASASCGVFLSRVGQALVGFFAGYLGALLASFGKPNRNRLFAAFYGAALAASSRFEGAMLSPVHCAFD